MNTTYIVTVWEHTRWSVGHAPIPEDVRVRDNGLGAHAIWASCRECGEAIVPYQVERITPNPTPCDCGIECACATNRKDAS